MRSPVTWIRNLDLAPDGNKDHLVFVHATEQIFMYATNKDKDVLGYIYDDFVYLLLQKNQLTGEQHAIEHDAEECVKSERYLMLESSLRRDIECSLVTGTNMRPYHLMQLIQLIGLDTPNRWMYGEIPALLELSCWLLSHDVSRSVDVSSCQKCAALFNKSNASDCSTSEDELSSCVVGCIREISSELNRICMMNNGISAASEELAYLGCFASLIRACRMVSRDDILRNYLQDELMWVNSVTTK